MLVNPVATTTDSDPASVGDAENNTPEPGGADTTTSTGPGGATSNRTCALICRSTPTPSGSRYAGPAVVDRSTSPNNHTSGAVTLRLRVV